MNIEAVNDVREDENSNDVMCDVLVLPMRYRKAVYLHYLAGHKTDEIATLLSLKPAKMRKRLQRGREMLRLDLERE